MSSASDRPLADLLREETATLHDRVEGLEFPRDLAEGRVRAEAYAAYLVALSHVHAALDEATAGCRIEAVKSVAAAATAGRGDLLRDDLEFLGPLQGGGAVTARAMLIAQEIRRRSRYEPTSLIGMLYVMEGSALGGLMLADLAARALGFKTGEGTRYLRGQGRETMSHWSRFRAQLNALTLDERGRRQVLDGAKATFEGMYRVMDALSRDVSPSLRGQARELNPSAGSHAITADARELDAALRAGEHTWSDFPYYAARYGERGRRFTRSDSAWLAGLSGNSAEVVYSQVNWLVRVLAARGMPRILMERHLRTLHAFLARSVPERRRLYRSFGLAARKLREIRRNAISEADFQALGVAFDRAVGPEWSRRLPRMGILIASAAADEVDGIYRGIESFEPWLTDPSRFPDEWISAVQLTLEDARRIAAESTVGLA